LLIRDFIGITFTRGTTCGIVNITISVICRESCGIHTLLLDSFPTRRSSDLGSCQDEFHSILSVHDASHADDRQRYRPGCLIDHRSEEHTSELQSRFEIVCRLQLEKEKSCQEKRHGQYNQ